MKRFIPLGLTIAILLAAVVVGSQTSVNAQSAGLVSSILNRMERNRRDLTSLRAGISMTKYNAQLKDEDRYSGAVAYKPAAGRDANVRIEWSKPYHEILAVTNGQYKLYRERQNIVYEGNARSGRAKNAGGLFELLTLSRQQVMARFEPLQYLGEETLWGGVSTWHLKLVPKGAASYKYAEIWVDFNGMPVQTKVVEKNDDSTTIRLTDMEKNARVSSDDFRLDLPGNVKRIRG